MKKKTTPFTLKIFNGGKDGEKLHYSAADLYQARVNRQYPNACPCEWKMKEKDSLVRDCGPNVSTRNERSADTQIGTYRNCIIIVLMLVDYLGI